MTTHNDLTSRRAVLAAMAVAGPTTALAAAPDPPRSRSGALGFQRSMLATLEVADGKRVGIVGDPSEWEWQAGDFTGRIASDPLHGVYQPHATVSAMIGCWARLWDGTHGRPEWFGAVVNNPAIDNVAAIQACINLCPTSLMGVGRYYIGDGSSRVGSNLLSITTSGRRLIGAGATQSGAASCTELVIRSASATGIVISGKPTAQPSSAIPGTWIEGVVIKDFTIRREVADFPLGNPPSGTNNSPCGYKLLFAMSCVIENIYTMENTIGGYLGGTVACLLKNNRHLRYSPGTVPGNDFFYGFYQDNSYPAPFNSGNASVYYIGGGAFSNEAARGGYQYVSSSGILTNYSRNGKYFSSAGIQSNQGFTDTYIIGYETANCGYGAKMVGRQTRTPDYHTEDLMISQCVFDGCRWDAVHLMNCGPATAVQVVNNYLMASNATEPTSSCVRLENCSGAIVVSNNQGIATPGNSATGLRTSASSGFVSSKNIWTDLAHPVLIEGSTAFRVEDRINVAKVAPADAAVEIIGSVRGIVDCDIASSVNTLTIGAGVKLTGASNSHIEVRGSGIHTPNITGGATNKLLANGSQITAAGSFSAGAGVNCLYSGIVS
ncbi:MAG: hypothetical protein JWO15_1700 [Sphingomonadales bacterium]|nr:hypothetical protein [Sphingomonadales bacterium]